MRGGIIVLALAIACPLALGATDLNIAPGLITTSAIHDATDLEGIIVLQQLGAAGTKRVVRWIEDDASVPGGKKVHSATFLTRPEDIDNAPRIITVWQRGDPDTIPGATHGMLSRALFRAIVDKGQIAVIIGAARISRSADVLGGLVGGRKYYRGTLQRVEKTNVPVSVIVDGRRTTLPTIHVKGTVSVGADSGEVEWWILDEERYPILLSSDTLGGTVRVVRIDTPPAGHKLGAGAMRGIDIGNALSKGSCHAELHGVYFASGSAQLLPESRTALEEIGALLNAHAEWNVIIEGHTDNIGSADLNLALSRARADAVLDALVKSFKIPAQRLSAIGYGMTRPIETNATLEGRARNRRVELARKCS